MTVAFIGHRKIQYSSELREELKNQIKELILYEKARTFLFGSKSEFNDLCYDVVTELKKEYPYICRVYIRAEFEFINKSYLNYLLSFYEKTFYPTKIHNAGSISYIKRNQIMIDMCNVLVVYYDVGYIPSSKTKSGTRIAIEYAEKKSKRIINLFGYYDDIFKY